MVITIVIITIASPQFAFGYSILPDAVMCKKHLIASTDDVELSPHQAITSYIMSTITLLKNPVMLEALYTFKKPKTMGMRCPFNTADKLVIINILHSLRSMEGIKYYSHTRKRLHTLFEKSYIIQYPSMKQADDPVITVLNKTYSFYSLQKDTTFGKILYYNTIELTNNFIVFHVQNVTTVTYTMFPVMNRGKFHLFIFFVCNPNTIEIYCMYLISESNNPFISLEVLTESLYNRLDAIILAMYKKLFAL